MAKLFITPIDDALPSDRKASILSANDISIQTWSKSVTNAKVLEILETATVDPFTTSASYVDVPSFAGLFSISNPLVHLVAKLCISATSTGAISVLIDNQLYDEYYFGPVSIQTINLTEAASGLANGKHSIKLQWRIDNGTLTRHIAGRSKIQITNLASN